MRSIFDIARGSDRHYLALPSAAALVCLAGFALFCTGCPALETLPSQARVMEMTEAQAELPYLLYVPSTYSVDVQWPLVVACHGTWPWDIADRQMREWARFAESKGIIVVAPRLLGTKGDFPPPAEKQIELQNRDEKAILAIVSAVKRRYNIAEEQVFMTGWSAGAYTILHTGLRNPDVFRALAIRQGSFDSSFMDIPKGRLDRWQKILVIYGMADFLRDQSKEMLAWLRDHGLHPDEKEVSGSHRRLDPNLPWRFFREVVKKFPWLRVRCHAVDTAAPLTVQFYLDTIPRAKRQKWFFGDGSESYEPSPQHTYAKSGRYEVTVNVALEGGKKYSRRRVIRVRPF